MDVVTAQHQRQTERDHRSCTYIVPSQLEELKTSKMSYLLECPGGD